MAERTYNYKKNMTISKAVANRTAKKKAAKKGTGYKAGGKNGMSTLSRARGYSTRSSNMKRTAGEPANRKASDRRYKSGQRAMATRTPARTKGEPANRGTTSRSKMINDPGYGVRSAQQRNKRSGYGEPPSRTKSKKTRIRYRLRRA